MTQNGHPDEALFEGEKPFPTIAACEHFAGSEKLIRKALQLQESYGPIFDVTCDCEDGAASGRESAHAEMVASIISSPANKFGMAGVRIHDPAHSHCKSDIDIVLAEGGDAISYLTIPKVVSADQLSVTIEYIRQAAIKHGISRPIPLHVLIETHGALAEIWKIAALPWIQVLDFGQMDFVSGHCGAIPASAMRSPDQFEHRLLVRAKAEIVAAALAHGIVPAHNVCLDLKNPEQVRSDASRARREFGFLRMWSIHPIQIMPIIEAMRPDHSELEDAAAILLAAQDAQWGPIQYKGELHDRATYRYFWSALQRARVTGADIPESAQNAFFSGSVKSL